MERGGEPTPGAVQADAGGVAGTAEDDSDLAAVEAFPAGQREDLAVGVAEAAERGGHAFKAGRKCPSIRRQAVRKVSPMTSAASSALPVRRSA